MNIVEQHVLVSAKKYEIYPLGGAGIINEVWLHKPQLEIKNKEGLTAGTESGWPMEKSRSTYSLMQFKGKTVNSCRDYLDFERLVSTIRKIITLKPIRISKTKKLEQRLCMA